MNILDFIWVVVAAAVGSGLGPPLFDHLSQRFLENYRFKKAKQRFRFEKFHDRQSLVYAEAFQKLVKTNGVLRTLVVGGDKNVAWQVRQDCEWGAGFRILSICDLGAIFRCRYPKT